MKNKKILLGAVTVLLAAAVLLTGCSDEGPSSSSSGPASSSGSSQPSSSASGKPASSGNDSDPSNQNKWRFSVSNNSATLLGCTDASYSGDLKIPEKTPEGVKVVSIASGAFKNCHITSVTIPSTVTEIGAYAFANTDLKSLVLPKTVVRVGMGAFYNCRSLTSVVLNGNVNFDGSANKGVFAGCVNLTTVNIANGLTRLGDGMFANCKHLETVTMPVRKPV